MPRLCVFCGSNAGSAPAFATAAAQLGTALASRDIGLVYGGGDVGLMGTVADAVLAAGGDVTGVIPEFLERAEVAHHGLTELHVVGSMHARKALMAELAEGFIALPGGFGTLDELAEALTWTQLGLQAKPVVLLDVDGFWEPLVRFFDAAVEHGFVRPAHRMLVQRTVTVDDAIALATSPVPRTQHKWLDRDGAR
ncbi:MAG TPA: TIGR00730 family Rossman fold protein [Acidimicrobiales bacterium]